MAKEPPKLPNHAPSLTNELGKAIKTQVGTLVNFRLQQIRLLASNAEYNNTAHVPYKSDRDTQNNRCLQRRVYALGWKHKIFDRATSTHACVVSLLKVMD